MSRFMLEGARCFEVLSHEHRDGWGIGHYDDSAPVLVKSVKAAHADSRFARTVASVRSDCVLAHIRKRSVGGKALEDSHPFQWGRLLFAHNGTIRDFEMVRAQLESAIAPRFARELRGSTDSERCFLLFLTALDALGALDDPRPADLAASLASTVRRVTALAGAVKPPHALNFVVSDGRTIAGVRSGSRPLCYCAWGGGTGVAQEVAIASEALTFGESWTPIDDGEIVVVDSKLGIERLDVDSFADVAVA